MSLNKKILFGNRYPKSVNEDIPARVTIINPEPPVENRFTMDSTEITMDMMARTFDEN